MKSFLLWGFHPTWGQIGLYAMHIVGITKREGSVISSSGGLREPVVPLRQLKLGISLAHLLSRRPFSCSWHAVAQISIQSAALCYVSSLAFSLLPNFASLLNCQTMPKNCYFSWLIIARCVCVCVCCQKEKAGAGLVQRPGSESRAVVWGRSWVVQELCRLHSVSTSVWDLSERFVVYHTWLELPTTTPNTPLRAEFHLYVSFLLSCFLSCPSTLHFF